MKQRELKRKMYGLVGMYFESLKLQGNIIWGKTKPVNPNSPMVALLLGPINRAERPIRRYINGIVVDTWPSETILQVDLFTKGAKTTDDPNVLASNENTAVNDLTEFVNFLHSSFVDDWGYLNDISINADTVQDLTALTNNTQWTYRAMVEIHIVFAQGAVGHTATNYEKGAPYYETGAPMYDEEGYALDRNGDRLPGPPLPQDEEGNLIYPEAEISSSGGGSQELADLQTGWFEEVEIEYVKKAKEA